MRKRGQQDENIAEKEQKPELQQERILNLAVVIMGSISCYTTSVGITPMLGNKFFAFAVAIALSMFMIVIAISIPGISTKTKKRGSVFAYSMVAIFSVLLNFNAIYGLANSKTLLYEELDNKRSQLISLQRNVISDIDTLHNISKWRGELEAAQEKMEGEKRTPGEEGCGPKCRKIYRDEVLPAMGELKKAEEKAKIFHHKITDIVKKIYPEPINSVLQAADPKEMSKGIEDVIEVYQDISKDIGQVTKKTYPPVKFENKNAGNLNHAVNTIFNIGDKGGEAKASIMISLLISFLIDFIILFVVLFLAPKVEMEEEEKGRFSPRTRGKEQSKTIFWNVPEGFNRKRNPSTNDSPFVNRN